MKRLAGGGAGLMCGPRPPWMCVMVEASVSFIAFINLIGCWAMLDETTTE
jgi:hypothetical protein